MRPAADYFHESKGTVPEKQAEVASDVRDEAVRVVDDVLLQLLVAGACEAGLQFQQLRSRSLFLAPYGKLILRVKFSPG